MICFRIITGLQLWDFNYRIINPIVLIITGLRDQRDIFPSPIHFPITKANHNSAINNGGKLMFMA